MKTYRFLIKNTWVFAVPHGYANGYVAVSKEHPLYGKHYDDVDEILVHGGVTYSGKMVPRNDFELLDGDLPEEYWCFGFDTIHCDDNSKNCDRAFCINEVTSLQTQLENYETIQKN